MNQEPWYKRWWPALVALLLGALAVIASVAARMAGAKQAVAEGQEQRKQALDQGLAAQDATKQAQLTVAAAKQEQAEQIAEDVHNANIAAIEAKAQADAAAVAAADAPAALGASLKSARQKLKSGA
jgi:hypothetical protein